MTTELAPVNTDKARVFLAKTVKSEEIAKALGRHIEPAYFERCIVTAFHRTPKLMLCTPASLAFAVFQSAQTRLPVCDGTHRACLVPYKNEAVFQIEYRGLIDLAFRSGCVADITAEVVYEEDEFEYSLGDKAYIKHRPKLGGKKDITKAVGAYMVAHTVQGGTKMEVMDREQILAIRAKSAAFRRNDGPWADPVFEPSMWCKTVLRKGCKHLPTSVFPQAVHAALEIEDARDFKTIREAEVVISNPAPVVEERSVQQLQEEFLALVKEMDGPALERLCFETGIDGKIQDCQNADILTKAIAAAKEG